MKSIKLIFVFIILISFSFSCEKEKEVDIVEPSINLAIDSIIATKKTLEIWEECYITVYAQGDELSFNWTTNHGSMTSVNSSTVKYWGCPTCVGHNVVECMVTNSYGTVKDTIMLTVNP